MRYPSFLPIALMLAASPLVTPAVNAQSLPTEMAAPVGNHSSDLILWSQAEQPRRVPIPIPLVKPGTRPRGSNAAAAQIFTGTIIKDGNLYVLLRANRESASGMPGLQLDNQAEAAKFVGRQVKLVGIPDDARFGLQVLSIESIS